MMEVSISDTYAPYPKYRLAKMSAKKYLAYHRKKLLKKLGVGHLLRTRSHISTGAIVSSGPRSPPRLPLTDEAIEKFKKKRKRFIDPEGADTRLRERLLLNMWNADCKTQEQWVEYDAALSTMKQNRRYSTLPSVRFCSEQSIKERRKPAECQVSKQVISFKLSDLGLMEAIDLLEEGEIREEKGQQNEDDDTHRVSDIIHHNEKLTLEKDGIRAFLSTNSLTIYSNLGQDLNLFPPNTLSGLHEADHNCVDYDMEFGIDENDIRYRHDDGDTNWSVTPNNGPLEYG